MGRVNMIYHGDVPGAYSLLSEATDQNVGNAQRFLKKINGPKIRIKFLCDFDSMIDIGYDEVFHVITGYKKNDWDTSMSRDRDDRKKRGRVHVYYNGDMGTCEQLKNETVPDNRIKYKIEKFPLWNNNVIRRRDETFLESLKYSFWRLFFTRYDKKTGETYSLKPFNGQYIYESGSRIISRYNGDLKPLKNPRIKSEIYFKEIDI